MRKTFSPLDPEAQLGYVLVRVADRISRGWHASLRAEGINPRQFSMLACLARDPGLSQGELARRVMITPQSVSESLAALVDAGLCTRGEMEAGRPAHLRLTAAGKRSLLKAYPIVEASNRESFEALTSAERADLARLLGKLME